MTYRLVVGVDGSKHGNAALRWAVEEAKAHDGEIVAVVAPGQLPFVGVPGAFDRDEMEKVWQGSSPKRPQCRRQRCRVPVTPAWSPRATSALR